MKREELACVSALASLGGVGPSRLRLLLGLGDATEVWQRVRTGSIGRESTLKQRLGRKGQSLVDAWRTSASTIEPMRLLERCEATGIRVFTPEDPEFPRSLADDIEPPVVLWCLGNPAAVRTPAVAIVGTRRCTRYGHDVARRFGAELAAAGVSVVSGLALGIDAAAHAGVLDAPDGAAPPVGVVGTGLDVVYPSRNRALWHDVAERGMLLSESPPGAPAEAWRFPARNRLIAALTQMVIVVESAGRGGSLYTVDEAIRRDIEVRAVPGPVTSPASAGTNRLIADGAGPALSASEIIEAFGLVCPNAQSSPEPTATRPDIDQTRILDALRAGPSTLGHLVEVTGLNFESVAVLTVEMEGRGMLARSGGWYEATG